MLHGIHSCIQTKFKDLFSWSNVRAIAPRSNDTIHKRCSMMELQLLHVHVTSMYVFNVNWEDAVIAICHTTRLL